MLPIARLAREEARKLDGLLFDLDDTLLDHGEPLPESYRALCRLAEHGFRLLAVTGRPAGWGDVLARQWPVAAFVTENGAITFYRQGRSLRRFDPVSDGERERRRRMIAGIVSDMQERFPELTPASDNELRRTDFTFDIGEEKKVDAAVVERAKDFLRERGARHFASSVHLHVTLDGDDKASGAVRALHALFGIDSTLARSRYAFIGDSENDAACFAAFRVTIGVKNFAGRPTLVPRFITEKERGQGFAEAAEHLIALRSD
jgi:HAD superfamily hydrolase (TIGR01484 family)